MRVSMSITNYSWPDREDLGSGLGRIARAADDAGLDTVWVADHLIQADPGRGPDDTEMLEAYTTLGFLAVKTDKVRLGTMVTAVTYRPASLLIKAVTTLDVLSGGRAWLGVGAGYHEFEASSMGLPLPGTAERFERLDDTLRLAIQMWGGDEAAFEGQHVRLSQPVNSPQSVQRPHPPILIGGMGERKTLPLVARHGDACNLFDIPDGGRTIRAKLDVLARCCDAIGRPYDEIDKTLSTRLTPDESPDAFAQRGAELAALGIEHLIVITPGAWTDDTVARLGEAADMLRDT